MKIKAKNNETMFWVEKYKIMVSFTDGIANVEDKIGKEMEKYGYKQESVVKPKEIVEPKKQESVVVKSEETSKPSTPQPKFKI